MSLYDELYNYGKGDMIPMHMPGHKRKDLGGILPYSMDITEIEGFDDLHHRSGILEELSSRLAKLRNAQTAFPLVGGSTCGILSAVKAMTKPGGKVIMSRGCHKSVYHAVSLFSLETAYIYPDTDAGNGFYLPVTPGSVEKAFGDNPGAELVIITSPTYEGVISDIKSISAVVHSHGAKLLVDAAHGAHLGYSPLFPSDALSEGADAVVESLHKTLPALTQTAVIYTGRGMDPVPFEKALGVFETSSPSYLLLSSIDRCVSFLEEKGTDEFRKYSALLAEFDERIKNSAYISVPGHTGKINSFSYDRSKVVISCAKAGITGAQAAEMLRRDYRIEPEMVCRNYVLCMTSVCDDETSLSRLAEAINGIDNRCNGGAETTPFVYPEAEQIMSMAEAGNREGEYAARECAAGRVSLSYLWAYPPGIPLVVPGERITEGIIDCILTLEKSGIEVLQEGEKTSDKIFVMK